MQEGENHAFIDAFQARAQFDGARVSTIDGVRADFEDGWGLVRASNTTPILVVRFDGETELALERIKNVFRARMLAINPDLQMPF
jgi:phosphomannomutase / phosphoglucomutase